MAVPTAASAEASDETTTKNNKKMKKKGSIGGASGGGGGSGGGRPRNVLLRVAVAAKGGEVRLWDVPVSKQHGVNLLRPLQAMNTRTGSSSSSSGRRHRRGGRRSCDDNNEGAFSSALPSSSFYRSSRDQLSDADASLLFGGAFGSLALPEVVTALALLPNGTAAYAGLRDGTVRFLECSRVYATQSGRSRLRARDSPLRERFPPNPL